MRLSLSLSLQSPSTFTPSVESFFFLFIWRDLSTGSVGLWIGHLEMRGRRYTFGQCERVFRLSIDSSSCWRNNVYIFLHLLLWSQLITVNLFVHYEPFLLAFKIRKNENWGCTSITVGIKMFVGGNEIHVLLIGKQNSIVHLTFRP